MSAQKNGGNFDVSEKRSRWTTDKNQYAICGEREGKEGYGQEKRNKKTKIKSTHTSLQVHLPLKIPKPLRSDDPIHIHRHHDTRVIQRQQGIRALSIIQARVFEEEDNGDGRYMRRAGLCRNWGLAIDGVSV